MSRDAAVLPAEETEAGILLVVCYKCTRVGRFDGDTRSDCRAMAHDAGWIKDNERMICPRCPAVRA